MIGLEDIENTWQILSDFSVTKIDELRVREIPGIESESGNPLLAIDSTMQRQLLLPLAAIAIEDTTSNGVQIRARQLIDSGVLRQYAVIICRKPHLNELFSIIVLDILEESGQSGKKESGDKIAHRILNRWRELLARAPTDMPDQDAIIGIFGELWQLRKFVQINPQSVLFWRGPFKERYDFVSGRLALEVKTSLARIGRFVVIHGHDQLEATGTILYLAFVKLNRVETGGESLRDLVNSIIHLDTESDELWTLLGHAGFTNQTLDQCAHLKYEVLEDRVYVVDDLFPKITASSFIGGVLPNGVIKLEYTVDLSAAPPNPLSEKEAAAFYMQAALGDNE